MMVVIQGRRVSLRSPLALAIIFRAFGALQIELQLLVDFEAKACSGTEPSRSDAS
jgi:hypothetical protein